jgi:hypothetical protein
MILAPQAGYFQVQMLVHLDPQDGRPDFVTEGNWKSFK